MFEVGRICVKLAGRDSGKKCVVLEVLEKNFVLIDGETRRRKVNVYHLEPLDQTIDIKAKASHEDVKKAFKKLGIEIADTKAKKAARKPSKQRKALMKEPAAEEAPEKKAEKPKKK